jgi:hypothetical protein
MVCTATISALLNFSAILLKVLFAILTSESRKNKILPLGLLGADIPHTGWPHILLILDDFTTGPNLCGIIYQRSIIYKNNFKRFKI